MSKLNEILAQNNVELDETTVEYLSSLLESAESEAEYHEILTEFLKDYGVELDTLKLNSQPDGPVAIAKDSNSIHGDDAHELEEHADVQVQSKTSPKEKAKRGDRKAKRALNTPPAEPEQKFTKPTELSEKLASLSVDQPIGQRLKQVRQLKKGFKGKQAEETLIKATTIQSRFKVDTLETLSNDIDLKKVNITIGEKPILIDADLQLFKGRRYCLVGRNGVGKTTLFKAIAEGYLAGFPSNIRVMLVKQFEGSLEKNVIDAVMEADKVSAKAYREFKGLNAALEKGGDELVKFLRQLNLDRLNDELWENNQLAIKRSGARGATARTELLISEVRVAEAEAALNYPITQEDIDTSTISAQEIMETLHHILQVYDHDAAYAKARKILVNLRFTDDMIDGPISNLSGGWQIRVSLASALFVEPDLLLLDEPTNHLDLPTILWLQNYLVSLEDVTLVVVSHDKAFLEAVVDETIILRNCKLTSFRGTYDEYILDQEEKQIHSEKVSDALEKKKTHIEKSIQNAMKQAKEKGDDKKLQMVASRKKKLNERFGIERSASGHRFKLNKDMGGYHLTFRSGPETFEKDPEVKFSFPEPDKLRHHGSLIEMDNVYFSYGSNSILEGITLNIQPNDKIAIVGANGDGKSTLMNLLNGLLVPSKGSIKRHPQCKIGYFSQTQVTDLNCNENTLQFLLSKLDANEQEIRGFFSRYGITGTLMAQTIDSLSGGQKVRIAIGLCTFNSPNLLFLDEPTNHLDMDTVDALQEAIKEFNGGLVCVTHDRRLVETCFKVVMMVRDKKLKLLENGVSDFIKILKKQKKLE